ncbi:MAG: hypothetical protein R2734_13105 [Nocardioides sp.]
MNENLTLALWALGRGTGVVALVMFTSPRAGESWPARVARCPAWAASAWPTCTVPRRSPAGLASCSRTS